MDRSLRWRTIGLVVILVFSVLTLLPSFVGKKALPSWYTQIFDSRMQLGLDLQGGLHIVYSIDLEKAVDDKASEIKRDIEAHLGDQRIEATVTTPAATGAVTVRVADEAKRDEVRKWIMSTYADEIVRRDCPDEQDGAICVRVSSDFADSIKKAALAQAVETIRSRIDERGVAEPTVIEKGDDIIVELPGLDDENISRIKDIIARTAKLEFKVVDEDSAYMRQLFRKVREPDPEATRLGIEADVDGWRHDDTGDNYTDYYLLARDREEWVPLEEAKEIPGCVDDETEVKDGQVWCKVTGRRAIEKYLASLAAQDPTFRVPEDRQIAFELIQPTSDSEAQQPYWRTYFLDRAVRLTGSSVSNAVTIWDPQTNRPEVLVEFNRYGTRTFGDLTSQNVGKKMAIILDDKVASAPVIQASITGGRSNISMGGGTAEEQQREADVLVAVLKTGSLPAPLREESSAKLGPTLGYDAIAKTQFSFALGIVLVIGIMVGLYRFSGLIATTIVFINVLLMLAAMSLFGATLTLPGIAAVVLTVGMTVDGNVLIYERIRDELAAGKSVKGAVDIGFARAFSAILDGQLTTGAAGWVLLQYGSGPIQGFATMLLVGIGTTLFCNVWVTRLLFDWYVVKKKGAETLSI